MKSSSAGKDDPRQTANLIHSKVQRLMPAIIGRDVDALSALLGDSGVACRVTASPQGERELHWVDPDLPDFAFHFTPPPNERGGTGFMIEGKDRYFGVTVGCYPDRRLDISVRVWSQISGAAATPAADAVGRTLGAIERRVWRNMR